jgi:putative AlgH/UPF0301 family transcriptional regulator
MLSVSHELTLQLLQAPTSTARVMIGYAGWGPGQLDKEACRLGVADARCRSET